MSEPIKNEIKRLESELKIIKKKQKEEKDRGDYDMAFMLEDDKKAKRKEIMFMHIALSIIEGGRK